MRSFVRPKSAVWRKATLAWGDVSVRKVAVKATESAVDVDVVAVAYVESVALIVGNVQLTIRNALFGKTKFQCVYLVIAAHNEVELGCAIGV